MNENGPIADIPENRAYDGQVGLAIVHLVHANVTLLFLGEWCKTLFADAARTRELWVGFGNIHVHTLARKLEAL